MIIERLYNRPNDIEAADTALLTLPKVHRNLVYPATVAFGKYPIVKLRNVGGYIVKLLQDGTRGKNAWFDHCDKFEERVLDDDESQNRRRL
jgi:hypothetical protein